MKEDFISIGQVIQSLTRIENTIKSSKYALINESNNIKETNLAKRFADVRSRLSKYDHKQGIFFESGYNLIKLYDHWISFDKMFDGTDSQTNKVQYRDLIKETSSMLGYLKSLPIKKIENEQTDSTTAKAVEQNKLEGINNRRAKIRQALERARSENPVNKDEVKKLEEQYEIANQEFISVRKQMEDAKNDSDAKDSIKTDLDKAFKDLGAYTEKIDSEIKRLNVEYWASLISIGLLIVILLISYGFFIIDIKSKVIVLNKPLDVLPYTLGLGIFVGLIAVCLYLKGRANKITIELSTRLFNIHYLEGLMNLTNKLSIDHREGLIRINEIIGSLEKSYIRQVDGNVISENQMTKWERKEINNNPYLKILTEIKEILTKINK